jgi:hypothetical protein
MKRKYQGLFSILLILFTLIATVIYTWRVFGKMGNGLRISRLKSLPNITGPGPATVKEMCQLEKSMASLVYPSKYEPTAVNLKLWGYQPMQTTRRTAPNRQAAPPSRMDYSLTFAFASKMKRLCIINGSLYSEGSKLPEGGEIVKIEPKRVLVNKHRFTQWIPLAEKITESREGNMGKNKKKN